MTFDGIVIEERDELCPFFIYLQVSMERGEGQEVIHNHILQALNRVT